MQALTDLFLFAVAFVGGALNSVAGGGSFLALPALISVGVPAVAANATTTLAMWPGSLSSAIAYRREILAIKSWFAALGAVSLVGGLLGGWLLVRTSNTRFLDLLPWLMLAAALTFTFGARAVARLRGDDTAPVAAVVAPVSPGAAHPRVPLWILAFQLLIAIYGGYFGGGMGIMMLAGLAVAGMNDIHEMNGLKTLLAVVVNGMALIEFVLEGVIVWRLGIIMVAGGIVGGYMGAAYARRFPPRAVRNFVIVIAWVMTVYFFVRR
jgi:uncharacterized membrane protein YfcA